MIPLLPIVGALACSGAPSNTVDAAIADLAAPDEPKLRCRADGACLLFEAMGGMSAQNPCYSPDSDKILFTLWHGGYNVAPAGLFVT